MTRILQSKNPIQRKVKSEETYFTNKEVHFIWYKYVHLFFEFSLNCSFAFVVQICWSLGNSSSN